MRKCHENLRKNGANRGHRGGNVISSRNGTKVRKGTNGGGARTMRYDKPLNAGNLFKIDGQPAPLFDACEYDDNATGVTLTNKDNALRILVMI